MTKQFAVYGKNGLLAVDEDPLEVTARAVKSEHRAIIDGRPAAVTLFSGDRQARAALLAWLLDGAEIIKRCRVDNNYDRTYCREGIAEIAMIALRSFDRYRGERIDNLEYRELRRWVERELNGTAE